MLFWVKKTPSPTTFTSLCLFFCFSAEHSCILDFFFLLRLWGYSFLDALACYAFTDPGLCSYIYILSIHLHLHSSNSSRYGHVILTGWSRDRPSYRC